MEIPMPAIRFTNCLKALALTAALVGCATTHEEIGSTDNPKTQDTKTAKSPADMKLPPGMTAADMQACAAAATPGKQQAMLAHGAGQWSGTCKLWMTPEAEPVSSPTSSTVSMLMDGRFRKVECSGDMPGMGPFQGMGFAGFDNVAQKYAMTWYDNCGTGMMTGDGTLSSDGKTLTWTLHYNCPIQKKLVTMREVETYTSDNAMTLDMYGNDPHSGKEFKMMHIELTRQSS
jgi:hypothetical protein